MAVTKQRSPGTHDETEALTARAGFRQPTPLQRVVVPHLLAHRDLIVEAGEGSGRTIASLVPLLSGSRGKGGRPGAVILAAGEEDVRKIQRQLKTLTRNSGGRPESVAVGVDDGVRKEARLLSMKPEVIIGTPRRLIDHVRQGNISLAEVRYAAIEAPPEDPEFHRDVEFVLSKCPPQCQTALFVPSLATYEQPRGRGRHATVVRAQDWQSAGPAGMLGDREPGSRTRGDRRRGGTPPSSGENPAAARPGGATSTRPGPDGEGDMASSDRGADDDTVLRTIRAHLERAHSAPDAPTLARVARLVRRGVPLGRRSIFAAYLLLQTGFEEAAPAPVTTGKYVRLFINAGRNRHVFPNDILDLFTTRLGIKRSEMGEVKVLDNYSFVEIQSAHARRAVSELKGAELKGRKLAVDYARPRTEKKRGA